ncbi:MAG: RNA polymerase sigma factor SigJ [Actinomycetota bacterium]|nr:RNA polymerase sigma factor SigJ [Actinomycetota bacterium]
MDVRDFESHRPRLTAVAYGMLGSYADAEDVVQDAFLRWEATTHQVDELGAFLTTVVTRLAIDRLRSAQRRRETYVGPWLPEPIVSSGPDDLADVAVEAEQISLALMVAMERLNPVERAAFLLREVFDFDYPAIADIIDKSPANTRQIVTRARGRVGDPHRSHGHDQEANSQLVAVFGEALAAGELRPLVDLLAADVIAWSDGGADHRAARRPIVGADRVARFLLGLAHKRDAYQASVRLAWANGSPAFVVLTPEGPFSVMAFDILDGVIIGIRTMVNPEKLTTVRAIDWS